MLLQTCYKRELAILRFHPLTLGQKAFTISRTKNGTNQIFIAGL